jgi:hypothetical protein
MGKVAMTVDRVRQAVAGVVLLAGLLLASCARNVDALQAANQAQAMFEFHSDVWMNLHHLLYEEALRRHPQSDGSRAASLLGPTRLTPDELAAWDSAVSYYDREFIAAGRDLLGDAGLRQIKLALTQQAGLLQLGEPLPSALRQILQSAAPVYSKHWWPAHDAVNRQLLTSLTAPLQKYGQRLQRDLLAAYASTWPGGAQARVRVDVVFYANWEGGYSFTTPAQVTLASIPDERAALWRRLELLLHETSHTLFAKLGSDIAAAAQRLGRDTGELWHATLYFTTGEIVRRTLEQDGITDYVPLAYQTGLFAADSEWSVYARALEKHWQPYLSGSADYESSLIGLVDAMPAQAVVPK